MKSAPFALLQTEELLKRTTSRCPICHVACLAEVWRVNEKSAGSSLAPGVVTPSTNGRAGRLPYFGGRAKVFLKRTCPIHGEISVCIASDARFYWLAIGRSENSACGCGTGNCRSADGSSLGTLGRNAEPGD